MKNIHPFFKVFIFVLITLSSLAAQAPKEAVITTKVVHQKINKTLSVVGSFLSLNAITLKAEIEAIIEKICFEDGASVKAGELLFKLHNGEQKANVKKADAALKLSINSLERKKTLAKNDFLSREDLEKSQAEVKQKEAELDLANEAFNKTFLKAPFNGVLSSRKVSQGAYISRGDALVNLNDLQPLRFSFPAAENQMNLIKKGQKITITTDAFPHELFSGVIDVIEPIVNEKTRAVMVHALLQNNDLKLRAGLFGSAILKTDEVQSALVIPEEALIIRQDGSYVYKVMGKSSVKLTKVTLGMRSDDLAEVLTGLTLNDEVVLKGQEKLKDGSEILIEKTK